MTNGADTNCRTLRADPRTSEGVFGTGGRGMNGQREVSRQGIVRPTFTFRDETIAVAFRDGFCVRDGKGPRAFGPKPHYVWIWYG